MADSQLDLFSRKKYTGILPQTVEIVPPAGDSTVLQTLPAYHTYLSSGGYSKYTPDDFTSDVRKFGLFVKDKRIGELRTADIQQWIAELKKVLSAKTVSRKVTALSNYFQWLVSEGVFDQSTNPAGTIRSKRVTSPLPDILFESECQALLRAASNDPRSYFLVLLLLETGLKKEELFELRTVNFDLSNRYAPAVWLKHTGKKVSKDRKLRLPAELAPVYEEYVKKYGINEIVFPYTPRFIEMLLTEVAHRAGLQKKVTAGILRDSFVVRSLKRGEGIDHVLRKIGLSESTWEDAKIKYQKLSAGGI
jgi:site-specific recombinase XerD